MKVRFLLALVGIILLPWEVGYAASQDADTLIIGIDSHQFWKELGVQTSHVELSRQGLCFSLADSEEVWGARQAVLAVYTTVGEAKMAFQYSSMMVPVAPVDKQYHFGDGVYVWSGKGDANGTILFRVKNMVVQFIWSSGLQTATEFANKIDSLLRSNHPSVKKGQFSTLPKIEGLPSQKKTTALALLEVSPEYKGFGDKALRRMVWAPGFTDIDVTREGKVRFKAPAQEGEYRVTLIVATDECLIVKREFTVLVRE